MPTNLKLMTGIGLLAALVGLAAGGPSLARSLFPDQDPLRIASYEPMQRPSSEHPIGTDLWGRDALAVFLNSVWQSMMIGLIAGALATSIGTAVGFVSGYSGGALDSSIRTVVDMFLVLPTLPIFLTLTLYISRWNIFTLSLLLGLFTWPFGARIIRAQALSLRKRDYVDMARLSGQNPLEIIFLELMPALSPFICLGLSASIVAVMLAEAGLQFVGIGAGRLSTLGYMIGEGFNNGYMSAGLHAQLLLPASVLVLVFLSLQLINMGLEEVFNPKLRKILKR